MGDASRGSRWGAPVREGGSMGSMDVTISPMREAFYKNRSVVAVRMVFVCGAVLSIKSVILGLFGILERECAGEHIPLCI